MTYKDTQEIVKDDVQRERNRQDNKWGEQNHDLATWMMILQEEIGEMANAYLEFRFGKGSFEHLYEEAIQSTAVLQAMCECLKRNPPLLSISNEVTTEEEEDAQVSVCFPEHLS